METLTVKPPIELQGRVVFADGSMLLELPGEVVMMKLFRGLAFEGLTLRKNPETGNLRVIELAQVNGAELHGVRTDADLSDVKLLDK